jgi:hypothetical protein
MSIFDMLISPKVLIKNGYISQDAHNISGRGVMSTYGGLGGRCSLLPTPWAVEILPHTLEL